MEYTQDGDGLLLMAQKSALTGHEYKLKKIYCHSHLRANFSFSY